MTDASFSLGSSIRRLDPAIAKLETTLRLMHELGQPIPQLTARTNERLSKMLCVTLTLIQHQGSTVPSGGVVCTIGDEDIVTRKRRVG